MEKENKGMTIDFAEKYSHLICEDIPKMTLPLSRRSVPIPAKYRKKFIHKENGFAYNYCMSEEEQEKVRKTRKRTLNK